jgi:hypothetical protein
MRQGPFPNQSGNSAEHDPAGHQNRRPPRRTISSGLSVFRWSERHRDGAGIFIRSVVLGKIFDLSPDPPNRPRPRPRSRSAKGPPRTSCGEKREQRTTAIRESPIGVSVPTSILDLSPVASGSLGPEWREDKESTQLGWSWGF